MILGLGTLIAAVAIKRLRYSTKEIQILGVYLLIALLVALLGTFPM